MLTMHKSSTTEPSSDGGRARLPDVEGFAVRDGVKIAWARYGTAGFHVLMMPAWSIVHSRIWKAQVPYLSRHYRVTTFDGRGSGRSDRPKGAAAYTDEEYAADTLAVMNAAGIGSAVLVGLSSGADWAVRAAGTHPDRVAGLIAIGGSCRFAGRDPEAEEREWLRRKDSHDGWDKFGKHYWLDADGAAYDDFLRFFFAEMFHEPHSTKQIEDGIGWGHEVEPEVLVDTVEGRSGFPPAVAFPVEPLAAQVRCPVVVLHGTEDAICSPAIGERLAKLTSGRVILVEGGGHGLPSRDPVLVNREIRAFVDAVAIPTAPAGPRRWTRALRRGRRVLYLSSPIGLGHARRDVAIADELRLLHPDLRDRLADPGPGDPDAGRSWGTRAPDVGHAGQRERARRGRVRRPRPARFQAIRRMDEILVHNFTVFTT